MPSTVADDERLSSLWDAAKNDSVASSVPLRNYKTAWWKCDGGHSFQRAPRMMQRDPSCPMCKLGTSALAAAAPGFAAMWHPTKNGGLLPTEVAANHQGPCWWVCLEGHDFQRSPLEMSRDSACPTCELEHGSLAVTRPDLAAQWHPDRNGEVSPEQLDPYHVMLAWWRCYKGHEFQLAVRSRVTGHGRCPYCYGAWSVENIRTFVKALLGHIDALNPSEMFALAMQAGVLRNKDSRAFVMAVSTGRFPKEELEKFSEGEPSAVDEFAGDGDFNLEILDAATALVDSTGGSDEFGAVLPDGPASEYTQDDVELDVGVGAQSSEVSGEEESRLPVIETRDALAALDSAMVANADAETVKFLLDSAKSKLWRHAFADATEAREQATGFAGDTYSTIVRDRFLSELNEAENLELPAGYGFRPRPNEPIAPPHLMQKHVAVRIRNDRRFGNWSGMGAGKTLSALLATRIVDSDLTFVCCPNAVVDNWVTEIENAFPGADIVTKTWTPQWCDPLEPRPRYLVMNFEQFQQPSSESDLVTFLDTHVVDFVVIDEIHFAKQRHPGSMSKRKRLVQGLVLAAGGSNPDLCVLGMSGTPVINELQEGKSLVEMITGHRHDDLKTKATVQNCMRLYQRLVTLGTRWQPDYSTQLDESNRPEIDCEPHLDEIRKVGRGTVLELERVLTRVRLPAIIENLVPGEKTLIYTHYVDGIISQLREAISAAGYRVGTLSGQSDDLDLQEFKKENGLVDVLIASSRVSTGVDGLQYVCSKLIINSLPWTNAEYEQLRGRLWRQGSVFDHVKVIIPVTFAYVNGERWSYCESKLHRLEYKKSIADAAVDGVVPEGNLRTPAQAQQDIMGWLGRLEGGELEEFIRPAIKIPLSRDAGEVKKRQARYGDFTRLNNTWYASTSAKTHERLASDPQEWAHYHTMYQELRESWEVVPFKEEIQWLSEPQREGMVVGDFGCGEALLAAEVGDRHLVHSFDHVAVNQSVVPCDMASVPLEDNVLDLAVFCLSLMGANFKEYIREAQRCLHVDGQIHIWEPVSYFDDVEAFCVGLEKMGFYSVSAHKRGNFMLIWGAKDTKKPIDSELPFRGH